MAVNKHATVFESGIFFDGEWQWNIIFRRRLFNWEVELWNSFWELLGGYSICTTLKDSIVWKLDSSGNYSPKSFCMAFLDTKFQRYQWWKDVWAGLAPPKVETLCWQIILGKVAIKAELNKRGILRSSDTRCVFFNSEEESVTHLFFLCDLLRQVWEAWLERWNVSLCAPSNPILFLLSWNLAVHDRGNNQIWKMGFFSIIWTIWLKRNEIVFNAGSVRVAELIESSVVRTTIWGKAKWPDLDGGVVDFLQNIDCIRLPLRRPPLRAASSWSCSCIGSLKFNVDGSAMGKPGPTGIRGVLRDHEATVKI
ncbi:hypothetical protein PTKIN_Ptkin16aG0024000 [Pterospermum kingtungense]